MPWRQSGSDDEDFEYGHHHHPEDEKDEEGDEDATRHSARVSCRPSLKYVDETSGSNQSVERLPPSFSPGKSCSPGPGT